MHEIYNRAWRVCVWLGEANASSESAISFVKQMLDLKMFDTFAQSKDEAQSLANFAELLRRPWFRRRWIVQELAVARKAQIYCGNVQVSWTQFAGAIALFSSKHVNLKDIFKASDAFDYDPEYLGDVKELSAIRLVHAASNFFRKSDDGEILEKLVSLEDVVSMLATFDAKDPRDIIYAVLSLANDVKPTALLKSDFEYDEELMDKEFGKLYKAAQERKKGSGSPTGHSLELRKMPSDWRLRALFERTIKNFGKPFDNMITINYKSSVFEVYKDFVELAVTNSKSLDILCRPWAADDDQLPSWIPRKSGAVFGLRSERAYSRVRADLLVGSTRSGGKNYSASGETMARWDYRPHEILTQSLVVQGFVLNTIGKKLVPAMGGIIPAEWVTEWNKLRPMQTDLMPVSDTAPLYSPLRQRTASGKKLSSSTQGKSSLPSDSFWRTLVADRGPEGQKPPPPYFDLACDHAIQQRVTEGHQSYLDTREMMRDNCPSIVKEFLGRVQAVTWMRRLIVTTDEKMIGLVPYETKKKDHICILQGCSVPVILRRHSVADTIKEELRQLDEDERDRSVPTVKIEDVDSEVSSEKGEKTIPLSDGVHSFFLDVLESGQNDASAPVMEDGEALVRRRQILQETLDALEDPAKATTMSSLPLRTAIVDSTSNVRGDTYNSETKPQSGPSLQVLNVHRSESANSSQHQPKAEQEQDRCTPALRDGQSNGIPATDKEGSGEEDPKIKGLKEKGRAESWRRHDLPKYWYEFIGECYIHGMMDGEAMKRAGGQALREVEESNPPEGAKQVFWLR